MVELTIPTVISLAAADAVNPCEMAILILVLLNILIANPNNKKKVLEAGLAFCLAIFIMYFLYGLVIIQFFNVLDLFLKGLTVYIFKGIGIIAIILGLLNLKDYFWYKPGSFATEMPLNLRPRMKRWVNRITNPAGAFYVGLFVSVFLLPCTMGPYIVAGNILSVIDFIGTIPWLILYNIIFVIPMAIITFMVYFGISTLEDVNVWKDRNIRYLHLIAGILIIIVGILMVMGKV